MKDFRANLIVLCMFMFVAIATGLAQTPTLTVNNASGTGDITDFQAATTNKVQIDLAGDIKLVGSNTGISGAQGNGSSLGSTATGVNFLYPTSNCWKETVGTPFTPECLAAANGAWTAGHLLMVNSGSVFDISDASISAANVTQNSSTGSSNALSKWTAGHTLDNSAATDDSITLTYSGTGGVSSVKFTSTTSTGTPPLAVTSTTPVANLSATPTTYNAAGTQQTNAHIVIGTCTLAVGSTCTVTLSGSAAFSSSSSYVCVVSNRTAATAERVNQTSGSAFTVTGGSVSDVVGYNCIGT